MGGSNVLVSLRPNTQFSENIDCVSSAIAELQKASSPVKNSKLNDTSVPPCITSLICKSFPNTAKISDPKDLAIEELDIESEHLDASEGREYVLGYVVNKFGSKYPFLGGKSDDVQDDWISCINRGGLKRMNADYAKKFNCVDAIFSEFHGDSLVEGTNIVRNMTMNCLKFINNILSEVLEFYIRCRLYFRIRIMNRKLLCNEINNVRQHKSKMRKLVL